MERRVTVVFTQEDGKQEQVKIDAPDITMEEAQILLIRASNYIGLNLVRNTILRELAKASQQVVLAGDAGVGIDPRRLRS